MLNRVDPGKTYTLYALAGVVKMEGVRGCRLASFVPQNPYLYAALKYP
ncbi:hypothetical protein [Pyrobaculum aerophilum]|nr:hypothetical protein [Pyrobaculum aerophilum]